MSNDKVMIILLTAGLIKNILLLLDLPNCVTKSDLKKCKKVMIHQILLKMLI